MYALLSLLVPIFSVMLPVLSVFMILLILVQRGRGGGLVGAFGGMGGQSAFGARAGDVFTKITVITVIIWIAMCIGLLLGIKYVEDDPDTGFGGGRVSETTSDGTGAPMTTPIPSSGNSSESP